MRSVDYSPEVNQINHHDSAALSCGILIPAYNEAQTISTIIRTALESNVGPVLVVDDGSTDDTAHVAKQAGADVLSLEVNQGKGGAVFAGASHLTVDVLVLLDADLTGLTPAHVQALITPVLTDNVDMTRGVFMGGRWATTVAQRVTPQLNGQRAIKRPLLLSVTDLASSRYGIEIAITEQAKRDAWRQKDVFLEGVSQVMKEEKRGFLAGFSTRLRMYAEIIRVLLKRF